jgi:hypothetical protein
MFEPSQRRSYLARPKGTTFVLKRDQGIWKGASAEFPQWGKNYLLPFPDDYSPPENLPDDSDSSVLSRPVAEMPAE